MKVKHTIEIEIEFKGEDEILANTLININKKKFISHCTDAAKKCVIRGFGFSLVNFIDVKTEVPEVKSKSNDVKTHKVTLESILENFNKKY